MRELHLQEELVARFPSISSALCSFPSTFPCALNRQQRNQSHLGSKYRLDPADCEQSNQPLQIPFYGCDLEWPIF